MAKKVNLNSYGLAKLPVQTALVADVGVEYGQMQLKLVAFDDEQKPP